jgi:hypothetical protein
MTYLYETPARPPRLVLTAEGQPSLTLPVDPALYAGLRQLALAHEAVFLAWAQMALRKFLWEMEDAGTGAPPAQEEERAMLHRALFGLDTPPAREEEPVAGADLAPPEDEDFPF